MQRKMFFYTFMSIWIVLIVFNFVVPKVSFSEQENRMLASFPTFDFTKLVEGEYLKEMESYINDHFVFRDLWLKVKSTFEQACLKTENTGIYIGEDGYLFEKQVLDETKVENVKQHIERINAFAQNQKVPITMMLIPNSVSVYPEKLPANAPVYDQSKLIEEVYQNLTSIKTIDVLDTLIEHKDEYIYFKTDHHMTSLGAYFVYQEYAKENGIPLHSLEDYEIRLVADDFLGTFDSKAQLILQEKDFMYQYQLKEKVFLQVEYDTQVSNSLYEESYLQTKDKYSYYLNGNQARVKVTTSNKNHEKLLVIKDSYAHNMAPFICNDFEEVHFIDLRYYKMSMSDYIEENGITQVLILYNVSNFVEDLGLRSLK